MDSGQKSSDETQGLDSTAGKFAPRIAERITRLGTETAFAVSAEAAAFGAEGHTIYPFHLGDLNIPTPATSSRRPSRPFTTARPATARTPASPSFARRSRPT